MARATALIAAGRSVDLGLAQINSKNLGWLGLSVAAAFDPCSNLAAAGRVLQDGYARARTDSAGQQAALRTALSFYNTGRADLGFANGYVGKVARAAAYVVPAIAAPSLPLPASPNREPRPAVSSSRPPPWDVFREGNGGGAFVINVAIPSGGLK